MLRYLFATMSMFVACNSTQIIESPQDECVVDTTLVSVKSTNIKKQDYIEKKWKSSTTSVPYDRVLSFSMDDGLPHSDVNDIIQDIYGYLWFATYGGLSKWDGYRIKTFRADNSLLTNDRVLCLLPAQDSLLYIGTEAGGLCFYDYKREQIMSIADDYSPAYGTDRVINYLFEDFEGTVWVCRNDGLGYLQKQSKHRSITSCFRWRDWNVQCGVSLDSTRLLLSTDAGLTIYNTHTEEREDVLRTSINSRCHAIRKLKDGRFALLGGWGVYIWDLKRNNLELICRYTARSVFEDHNQNIWIGSYESGVLKYNLSSQLVAHYHPELPTPHAIGSYEISSLFEDNSGVMWIGTIGAGLNRINIVDKNIKCYTKAQGIADNRVLTFMESTDGTLWISTRGGVDLFDRQTEEFTHLWINAKQSRDFNVVSAFFTDSKGNIWIGTWGSGLWVIDSNDVGVAISTGYAKARQVRHPAYGESLSVSKIIEDRDNHLWISTNSGLFVYSQDSIHPTNQWSHYSYDTEDNNSLSSNFITDIFADPDTEYKTIWVGARQGLHKIVFDKDGTSVCQRIDLVQAQGMNEPKVSFFVSEIHCDNNGCLWVATIGDGLQRMIEGRFTNTHPRFERFDTFNTEFYDNGLESLQEDNNGLFWIGGYGISRFNPATKDVKHYTVKDQLQSNAFKIWASYKMQDGTFVFGGVNGFNMFHPDSLADNIIEPRVTISRLKVWNNIIYAGDTIKGKLVLPCAIDHISCLELTHECNNLTFEFSSLVYNDPKHNKYKYRLSRIDKEWVETDGSSPQAVYSNLRSGKYTLTVYGSNEDGVWSETPAVMDIIITPPFYATHFAFVLYVLVILFSGYAFHRRSIRKVNERHQIEVERNRFIEEQKSSASMLQFYTDIAHELKTPISLIAAPVEELLMNHHLGATTRNRLSLVNKNIGALMNLIGQILDLRKYENQKMKLNATQVDLVPLLNDIAELFRPLATNQKINFIIDIPEEEVLIWIDRTKIETVVNNLLSNAFKYTNQGDVILSLVVDEVNAIITVKDDGIGIPKEDQSQIFDRFYQASNNKSIRKSVGIGLAKVKHIVDLHQGETKIESEVSVGSAFSIYLPINLNCPTSDQTVQMSDLELPILDATVSDNFEDTEITKPKESCVNQDKGVLILIAEDNVQLRTYLQTVLQPRYNTIVAEDGQVAYEMAVANSPDLILSDIVMPRMNGIDLCHCIKENKDTAHINVILLTAHDLQSNEIAGYKMGADGYISKPFSLEVLFAKIDALITKHDTMRQTLHMEIDAAMHEVTVENRDTQFLTKCINLVEANISDPQFNVQELGRLTGSSRSLLYRRIYSLTALTPVQFIREMRLKRAAQLLYQDSTLSVMEVMYSVGYTNPSHFSKIFYEKFGSNPKEFALKGKDYTGQ